MARYRSVALACQSAASCSASGTFAGQKPRLILLVSTYATFADVINTRYFIFRILLLNFRYMESGKSINHTRYYYRFRL